MGIRTFAVVTLVLLAGCDPQVAPAPLAATASPDTRLRLDVSRKRVWALSREGLVVHDLATGQRSAIALSGWVWAGPPYGCLPDLALAPDGAAVVTSDVLPTLWRIHPDSLLVSVSTPALDADADKDIGFSGLAWSAEQRAFFGVSHAYGTLWRISADLSRAQKIGLAEPMKGACALAMDDLAFVPDRRTALLRRK